MGTPLNLGMVRYCATCKDRLFFDFCRGPTKLKIKLCQMKKLSTMRKSMAVFWNNYVNSLFLLVYRSLILKKDIMYRTEINFLVVEVK